MPLLTGPRPWGPEVHLAVDDEHRTPYSDSTSIRWPDENTGDGAGIEALHWEKMLQMAEAMKDMETADKARARLHSSPWAQPPLSAHPRSRRAPARRTLPARSSSPGRAAC